MRTYVYDRGGAKYIIPDQWREMLGEDVISLKVLVSDRLKELHVDRTSFLNLCKQLDDFNSWYSPEDQMALAAVVKREIKAEQTKRAMLDKYGVTSPFAVKEIKQKADAVIREKYGVSNVFLSKEIQDKKKASTIRSLGVENPFNSSEIQQRAVETHIKKYGKEQKLQYSEVRMKSLLDFYGIIPSDLPKSCNSSVDHKGICASCGKTFIYRFNRAIPSGCPYCNTNSTALERRLVRLVEDNGLKTIPHYRPDFLNRREIDIYIPELNCGFEINGALTHNASYNLFRRGVPKGRTYHSEKSSICEEHGIRLYHIWEHWDFSFIQEMILNSIGRSSIKKNARDYKVSFNKEVSSILVERVHLRGACPFSFSASLVQTPNSQADATIQFVISGTSATLVRNCTAENMIIRGGFSKLLKHSIPVLKNKGVISITTYADRDLTPDYKDSVYFKCGFDFVRDAGPILSYYVLRTIRKNEEIILKPGVYNRQNFMKSKLSRFNGARVNGVSSVFQLDESLTEQENLERLRIYPVYNSGCYVFNLDI